MCKRFRYTGVLLSNKQSIRFCLDPRQFFEKSCFQSAVKHRHCFVPLNSAVPISHGELEDEEIVSKATLIWRAIKLPIYSVALVPLSVSSKLFYVDCNIVGFDIEMYELVFKFISLGSALC